MECQYCHSIVSTKYNLKLHQENAKYCLKLQGKSSSIKLKCNYCDSLFSRKSVYDTHIIICKVKKCKEQETTLEDLSKEIIYLKQIINEKDEENKIIKEENVTLKAQLEIYKNLSQDSQQCIKEIAKQPKTTTNNNTTILNNLAPLDMNTLTEQLTHVINTQMTEKHVIEGQEGIAKLVSCCFTTEDGKKLITCTDISRGIWKSKDMNGNIIKDYKASNLAKVIKPIASLKANEIIELDETKRNKIYEVHRIKKRRDERLKADKYDVETQIGYKRESKNFEYIEERRKKRTIEQRRDNEIQEEIIKEFKNNNELYLLDIPEDTDKPFNMYTGKQEIVEMSDDSTKFSNKLVMLV